MKSILSLIISAALVVSGYSQTRNVLVGTNNAVVQPTNFWSADATNARSGLGLGSAATNAVSAFQPASSVLTNLSASNGESLTNLSVLNIIGTLGLGQGGTGSTNASDARTALGLGTAATNPASVFQTSSANLTNLASNNAGSLTNLTANSIVGIIPPSNIPTVNFTNISGTLSIASGGTGATNAANSRQNLGSTTVGDAMFTATNEGVARIAIGATTVGSSLFTLANPNAITFLRINADNTASSLSSSDFRTAIGLDSASTNSSSAFQPSSVVLSNLASSNAVNLTNLRVTNIVGWSAITNTNAATSLLGFTTNGQVVAGTNVLTFSNDVKFGNGDLTVSGQVISGGGVSLSFEDGSLSGGITLETNSSIAFQGASATTTRTNLGLGWSALTNSNAGTGLVSVNTNGTVVSPTNFWTASPLGRVGYIQYSQPVASSTNQAEAARNLFVFSLTPTIFNVTNTIQLPVTTNGVLYGDIAVVVHKGPTNSATIVRNGIDLITLREDDEAISLLYGTNGWDFYPNLAFHEPIYFTTTNATLFAARSRTNLALGATWLTNTNVTNFRTAIGLGAMNDVRFNSISVYPDNETESSIAAGVDGLVFKYGTNSSFELGGGNDVFYRVPIRFNNTTNAAITRTNLGLGATWLTNTNVTNFRTAIGLGSANAVSFSTVAAQEIYDSVGNKVIDLENFILGVGTTAALEWATNQVQVNVPIVFVGTNSASTTRTNLGIPLAALTNTNNAGFQRAMFTTNTTPVSAANLGDAKAWMEVSVITNGITNSYRIPLFQ